MKTYSYTKTITEQQVNELMESALRGITYWADEAVIYLVGDQDFDEAADTATSEALTKGYGLTIHDFEEDKRHNLTLEKLLKGLSLANTYSPDQVDMSMGDMVVQYALFGKVIYG